ncbi:MAG: HD domain-containing phosphohydrolase [Acidobacteriota bacterium]
MAKGVTNKKARRAYQTAVTTAGIALWVMAGAGLVTRYTLRDLLTVLALAPLTVMVGAFPQRFRLPSGLRFTQETITFTLADAIVLLVACWHGPAPAIFIAGIEGFTSSRRNDGRLSMFFYSSAMMSLGAAAASGLLTFVLHYGFGETDRGSSHTFLAAAVALFLAGLVQFAVNMVLISTLIAIRHGNSILQGWKDFLWAAPMFLPTSTAASLMYLALQFDMLIVAVTGGPILLTIYLAHRQYRNGIQKRIAVMDKAHRETIEALAVAINAKDEVTHEHVLRVQIYAAGVARILGCLPAEVEALRAGALLHDIGKIAVPDYILNKPGKLTAAEFEKMKLHTLAGAQILSRVEFPYPIVPVVRHHHERWDGKGYPDGLSGEDIPLTARILTVVDCFDAVREDRQYRKGMTREEAIDLILRGSGTQYDPSVVGTFIAHLQEFENEIRANRGSPLPTFGIEPTERLSEAARRVVPAAGLAEDEHTDKAGEPEVAGDELAAMCDLAQAVIGAGSTDQVAAAFTEKLNAVVPHCMCAITLVDSKTGQNVVVNATGQHWMFLKGRIITSGEGVTGWVLANRKPFCNADPKLDLPPSLAGHAPGYRTLAAFPIIKDSTVYGAVSIYSSELDEYTPGQQRLLCEAVKLMASALSAVSATEVWEKRMPPRTDDDASRMGLADSVLEYELTH